MSQGAKGGCKCLKVKRINGKGVGLGYLLQERMLRRPILRDGFVLQLSRLGEAWLYNMCAQAQSFETGRSDQRFTYADIDRGTQKQLLEIFGRLHFSDLHVRAAVADQLCRLVGILAIHRRNDLAVLGVFPQQLPMVGWEAIGFGQPWMHLAPQHTLPPPGRQAGSTVATLSHGRNSKESVAAAIAWNQGQKAMERIFRQRRDPAEEVMLHHRAIGAEGVQ
mmetsp:Transcript_74183/g.163792  ORF Transcript_74183/g.163792 Transcript_74183/m.163792 type:complete len:221 (+) Transcript_74183:267-929(+)